MIRLTIRGISKIKEEITYNITITSICILGTIVIGTVIPRTKTNATIDQIGIESWLCVQ